MFLTDWLSALRRRGCWRGNAGRRSRRRTERRLPSVERLEGRAPVANLPAPTSALALAAGASAILADLQTAASAPSREAADEQSPDSPELTFENEASASAQAGNKRGFASSDLTAVRQSRISAKPSLSTLPSSFEEPEEGAAEVTGAANGFGRLDATNIDSGAGSGSGGASGGQDADSGAAAPPSLPSNLSSSGDEASASSGNGALGSAGAAASGGTSGQNSPSGSAMGSQGQLTDTAHNAFGTPAAPSLGAGVPGGGQGRWGQASDRLAGQVGASNFPAHKGGPSVLSGGGIPGGHEAGASFGGWNGSGNVGDSFQQAVGMLSSGSGAGSPPNTSGGGLSPSSFGSGAALQSGMGAVLTTGPSAQNGASASRAANGLLGPGTSPDLRTSPGAGIPTGLGQASDRVATNVSPYLPSVPVAMGQGSGGGSPGGTDGIFGGQAPTASIDSLGVGSGAKPSDSSPAAGMGQSADGPIQTISAPEVRLADNSSDGMGGAFEGGPPLVAPAAAFLPGGYTPQFIYSPTLPTAGGIVFGGGARAR
jgi:hypothetical protein